MKRITKETFLRAHNSPLATVQEVQYGNSLFGDFTTLVTVHGVYSLGYKSNEPLYFLRESRVYYKLFIDEVEHNFFMFDNAAEAKEYFAEAVEYADNYGAQNGTCAGGF